MFTLLVDKAVKGDSDEQIWGEKGYLFAENGEHIWGDLSRVISSRAKSLGFISDPKERAVGKDEAIELAGFEAVSWGLNSRGKAERARKYLKWTPKKASIEDHADEILKDEHERLSK